MKRRNIWWVVLILVSVVFADTTFFHENFDTTWTTQSPPIGWTINCQGTVGWDRGSSGIWPANHSGYAKIAPNSKLYNPTDTIIDSLISPVIDCGRYRNVVLRCSSFFRHGYNSNFYTAKIIGSKDGGVTYQHLIAEFYGHYDDTILPVKTFNLDWAAEKENVRIAFVFVGRIIDIQFWCLDNVSLTGQYIFNNDVATIEIIKPSNFQLPGPCTLQTKIVNLGKNNLYNITAGISISYSDQTPIICTAQVDSLNYRESLVVYFLPTYRFDSIPGDYQAIAWCRHDTDENPTNDTIRKDFSVVQAQLLTYNDSIDVNGECFPIREQGWGVKFTPSNNYPAMINRVSCYIGFASVTQSYRYKIRIVDDNGLNHGPGTTLYETDNLTDSLRGWNTIYLFNQELYIDSGSVYVFYIQVDDAPDAPLLFHDVSVNRSAEYYKYYNGSYEVDSPNGDWLIEMLVEFHPPPIHNNDLRVVFISEPIDEFVRRPVNIQIPIRARIENIGTSSQDNNFAVYCTVRSFLNGFPGEVRDNFVKSNLGLAAGRDTFIEFFPWQIIYNEPVEITVRVFLPADEQNDNNYKKKIVANKIAKFTGVEGTEYKYAWYDSDTTNGPVFDWYDTTNALEILDSGDDIIVPMIMLFDFPYYESTYNQVYVSTDGFLTFNSNQPASSVNAAIPSPDNPNNGLYIFWDDLVLPTDRSAKIYYQEYGNSPNRFSVITWSNVLRKDADSLYRLNFQIILNENGEIRYQYKDVYCNRQSADYGKSATIGLENQDGSGGLQYLLGTDTEIVNWPENKLSANRAIKFYRQLRDVGAVAIIAPPDSIVPLPTTPFVKIKNFGTQIEDSVTVYLSITKDSTPASPPYHASRQEFYMLPNEERTVQFPDWNAYTGNYIITCSTRLGIDQRYENDSITKSVLVTNWITKSAVPIKADNRRVKNGAMVYASDYHKIFVLKGGTDEFWCYDISNDRWESLPRMPKPPSGKIPKAGCALTYGQGRYIYAIKGGNTDDFYVYDIAYSTWNELAPIKDTIHIYKPKKPKDGAGLVYADYDGKIYAIVGNNSDYLLSYVPGDTPMGNRWNLINRLQDDKRFRHGASINIVDNILYIFQGNKTKNLHRYDLSSSCWMTPICTIPGSVKNVVKAGGTATYHSPTRSIYFFLGGNKQSLWQYNLLSNTFDSISSIPKGPFKKKIKSGAAITAAGPNDPIFALKGGNTNELWAYAFWSVGEKLIDQSIVSLNNSSQELATEEYISLPNTITTISSNMAVKIDYSLTQQSHVLLNLYTITGQLLETLINDEQTAGTYTISWRGVKKNNKAQKGIYFIKGKIGSNPVSKKIIIL